MSLLLLLCSLLGYTFFIGHYTRLKINALPFFTVLMVINLLYLASLVGWLQPSAHLIYYTGLGLFIFCMALFIKDSDRTSLARTWCTPSIFIFFFGSILAWLFVRHGELHSWDEFCHWGLVSKIIFQTNALPSAQSIVLLKDYPPGAALLHYFAYQVLGYSAGAAFFAQDILLLAALGVFLKRIVWDEWKPLLLTFTVFLLMALGHHGAQTLYVDIILAVTFATALVDYYHTKDPTAALIKLCAAVFCLTVIKSTGTLLAIFAILIAATDYAIRLHAAKSATSKPYSVKFLILMLCLSMASFVVANRTWSVHAKHLHATPSFPLQLTPQRIYNSFSRKHATERDRVVIRNFEKGIKAGGVRRGATLSIQSYALLLALLPFALFYFLRLDDADKRRFWVLHTWLIGGCLFYGFGLLILYLYAFTPQEAVAHASLGRYMNIYLTAWGLTLYGLLTLKKRT